MFIGVYKRLIRIFEQNYLDISIGEELVNFQLIGKIQRHLSMEGLVLCRRVTLIIVTGTYRNSNHPIATA